ncbi:hypothetical protein E3U55_08630 [Filobacillus milosensis]|uniref:DUF3139 domain-containing protein n=1 Tax=Filobacillus milosensis TaxID=94137 RepID=A0A4Y8IMF2_9BACI|nr:hypothetical protein [Filobacillus milosensis]TFB21371.1 hypothetical protein E3U55_08630 [Filobacillus milosensis]
MNKWLKWGIVVLIGCVLLVLNPKDLYYELRYTDQVEKRISEPAIWSNVFESEVDSIEDVSYIGDKFFEVKTNEGTYIVLYNDNGMNSKSFNIYKHHKRIGRFGY